MFFTFSSLLILSVTLLLVVALFAARGGKDRDERHIWFKLHIWTSFVFMLTVLFDDVFYGLDPRYFLWLQYPTVLLASITYGEFCYSVVDMKSGGHRRAYRWVVGVGVLAWMILYAQALQSGDGFAVLLLLPILLFSWPVIFLAASLRRSNIRLWDVAVLWQEKEGVSDADRARIGLFLITLLRIIGSAAPVLTLRDGVPAEVVYGVFFVISLFIVAGLVGIYLLFIEKRADLAYKITSALSVFLVSAFVLVVLAFYQENQPFRASDTVFLETNNIQVRPLDSGFRVEARSAALWEGLPYTRLTADESGAYRVNIPFAVTLGGKNFDALWAYENGQLVMGAAGKAPMATTPYQRRCYKEGTVIYVLCLPGAQLTVFVAEADDSIFIRWANEVGSALTPAFEARLMKEGRMEFRYGLFPKIWSERKDALIGIRASTLLDSNQLDLSDMPFVTGKEGFVFDLALGRRELIHQRLRPVVIFLIAAVATIVFAFRAYINHLIVRPLANINSGLAKVDEGRLDERLSLSGKDEFSDIADGFNHMIVSLDQARQRVDEQTELMEREIAFRTVEAAKKIDTNLLSKDQQFENRLREVIEANIGDFDFQVAELADAMAVSTRQLHRRVVDLTAQTPASLIRTLRLDHAHQLLSAKAANVSEAAYRSGFRDVSYFSKLFQKKFNIQPSELASQA